MTLTELTAHPGIQWTWQRRVGVWRRLLGRGLLRVHRLLVHRRHLRLVLHVIHGVHEVLLVRHPVRHHVLLGVHMVRHLLRLLQWRAAWHAAGRCCRCLQLARRIYRRRWRLVPVRPISIRFRPHMPHLGGTVWPVTILFHLLVVSQAIIGRKPWVGRRLRGVVVLGRSQLLVAALHLVALLRHRAIMRVRLLVFVATAVAHVRHVRVGEVRHAVAVVSAHRGPAARAARVRIFRRRLSAARADTITVQLLNTIQIQSTTPQRSRSLAAHAVPTDGVSHGFLDVSEKKRLLHLVDL